MTTFIVMKAIMIINGALYHIQGLGQVRFIRDESKGKCTVIFQGAPIEVDRYELKLAA
jgi:hypothetical protein